MRRITARVDFAIESETDHSLEDIARFLQDELEVMYTTVAVRSEKAGDVRRVHVSISEQEQVVPFAGDPQTNRTEAYPPVTEEETQG